jgi:hypothetical protein
LNMPVAMTIEKKYRKRTSRFSGHHDNKSRVTKTVMALYIRMALMIVIIALPYVGKHYWLILIFLPFLLKLMGISLIVIFLKGLEWSFVGVSMFGNDH